MHKFDIIITENNISSELHTERFPSLRVPCSLFAWLLYSEREHSISSVGAAAATSILWKMWLCLQHFLE